MAKPQVRVTVHTVESTKLEIFLNPASPQDHALVDVARDVISKRRVPGLTSVAAAVRATSGAIYTSLDCRSRMSAVCAEPGALAQTWQAGEEGIDTVVGVCFTPGLERVVVISPCGACRERIYHHAPDAKVLVTYNNSLVAVAIRELFPFAGLFE